MILGPSARHVILCLLFGLMALPVHAQETTLTVDEYEDTMKEINYVLGDAELHVDAMYWADLGADTEALRSLFARVQMFWEARAAREAVDFAGRALTANSALSRASAQSDRSAARQAIVDLKAACTSCHGEFREKTEDGYRIKPGR